MKEGYIAVIGAIFFFIVFLFIMDTIFMGTESTFSQWSKDVPEMPTLEQKAWYDIPGHVDNLGKMIWFAITYVLHFFKLIFLMIALDLTIFTDMGLIAWFIKIPIWGVLGYVISQLIIQSVEAVRG